MDFDQARARLLADRDDIASLLAGAETASGQEHAAQGEVGDSADSALALSALGVDDAIAAGLRDKLAAIDRALGRLDEGTYGLSVLSGQPIPEARLEADPTAELTVEELRAQR
jgi:DnaK suppressor protein